MALNWHTQNLESVLAETGASVNGLSSSEAATRLENDGPNELKSKKKKSPIIMFLSQFKDFMIIILMIAAAISGFIAHEWVDAIVIMILVITNAVIGTVQEIKAQNSLDALERMSSPNAKVLRDGVQVTIPARELVRGDIVLLDTGDCVPADLRLTEFASLKIQESALTGESVPVEKHDGDLSDDSALGDRVNMAFSSSLVTYGRGRGIVVETGMKTEVGKIASMLQDAPETQTPMQRRLDALGKTLGIAALAICGVMFIVGTFVYKHAPLDMFLTAISLAVAAIPEGLPTISTVVLALGVQRMAKRNAIVRTLPSVETLGSATVICSDKTGTLTQNRMTVLRYALPEEQEPGIVPELQDNLLIHSMMLCTDAQLTENGPIGDPTETALLEMGEKLGYKKEELEAATPRVEELPFDSDRKRMSTMHKLEDGRFVVYCKGGLDEILNCCSHIRKGNNVAVINDNEKQHLYELNATMAKDALRVLTVAVKYLEVLPQKKDSNEESNRQMESQIESDLIFVGMVGMIDPARPEAREAVAECHTAGIRPVMITGDHRLTAEAIAKDLDIYREGDRIVTGIELEKMSDEELYEQVDDISVYARVSPEHKVRIVDAWQKHGDVVAMTGDGVNDAPALKRADIGCAMGKVGTDVAKDSADLILVDDNFATIISAVEEGRRIFDNVLKSISFLLSCNIGEIITLFVAIILNWATPLKPTHLLLINLVTDGLPALALGVDPAEPNIMQRKAVKQKGIFTKSMIWRLIYQGVMVGVLTLIAFSLGMAHGEGEILGQTMAFVVLALSQIAHSFNLRSKTQSIFVVHPFQNMKLVGAGLLSLVIVILCVSVPGLNTVLGLTMIKGVDLLEVILLSISPIIIVEIMKLLKLNSLKDER